MCIRDRSDTVEVLFSAVTVISSIPPRPLSSSSDNNAKGKIEKVIEISLSKEEQMEFANSVNSVKGLIEACIKIDPSLGKK